MRLLHDDLMAQALDVEIVNMRPRFGRLTQVLSVVFLLAGLGACIAGLNSGHQTTPGSACNEPISLALGFTYLLVGVDLWIEYVWA